MQAALPALVASGNGAIVNVSSLIALIAAPAAIRYSASKSALRMMSRVTAMEYVKKGVRVNTIVPGAMQTPMQANVTAEADAWQRSKIPMGDRSEEHTSELQSLMRISYAVFCLKKNNTTINYTFNKI